MNAPAKTNEIDPLLHPAQVAKLLGCRTRGWLSLGLVTRGPVSSRSGALCDTGCPPCVSTS
jgi:hypothetical protein